MTAYTKDYELYVNVESRGNVAKLRLRPQKESATKADDAELVEAIREFRKELGLTQVQFAAELAMTPTTIYRYEAGTNTPTNDVLAKILQLAVKNQSLAAVQKLAEHLAKRSGFSMFAPEGGSSSSAFLSAVSNLRLERRILIMAAVLMEKEGTDQTALRVFETLVKPWIAKASETFGPLDVAVNPVGVPSVRSTHQEARSKEKL